ncbi:hypothetical protein TEK04_00055 [Klenkia sp. LSe6-5]|uniref:Mce-associated membrane protein n=1 Tax=Klenkia sesuvii TaxID=3103137 RepID=A0ABU8DPY5_9ACTN
MADQTRAGSREPAPADPDTEPPAEDTAKAPAEDTAADSAEDTAADSAERTAQDPARDAAEDRLVEPEDDAAGSGSDDRTDDRADDGTDDATRAAEEPVGAPARSRDGSRLSLPLVPVLAGLLVLLLAGAAFLWVTRPGTSSVSTDDYVDALQAARAGIVDVASFDYLTLDDDIAQIEAVTTGDLRTESVDQLDSRRQDITTAQAVVNTEVVGAAVGAADDSSATVYMVIQSTQTSSASEQAQVQRYRIEVDLTKDGDRWLLSGIQGR